MIIVLGIVMGVFWAFLSYKVAMSKGRKSFAPYAAILGFLLGLIGFAIVACVRSTPEAKKLRADAQQRQVPLDLHEEHNLAVQRPADVQD